MTAIPYLPAEWQTGMKRLPKHALCLSHRVVDGKKLCLAVPDKEADRHVRELLRFRAAIAKVVAAHDKREAARPKPLPRKAKATKTARMWRALAANKRHRHRGCLQPEDAEVGNDPRDQGWFRCTAMGKDDLHVYTGGVYELHEHRTKRGRRFLVAHRRGDPSCPAIIAGRLADEAAEASTSET